VPTNNGSTTYVSPRLTQSVSTPKLKSKHLFYHTHQIGNIPVLTILADKSQKANQKGKQMLCVARAY
jgi:hypothetical protein